MAGLRVGGADLDRVVRAGVLGREALPGGVDGEDASLLVEDGYVAEHGVEGGAEEAL